MILRPAPGSLPPGARIYAVGDVHGCDDRLAALHILIAEDLARRPTAEPSLVHLGDFIDRGSDSAGVVARLAAEPPLAAMSRIGLSKARLPMVNLRGNHERTMLEALSGERASATDWLTHGGREALASWRIDPLMKKDARSENSPDPRTGLWRLTQGDWARAIPAAHIAWLRSLSLSHRAGNYLFVHAGIRPGVPLDQQSEADLASIRHTFLSSERDHGAVIVHGHTVRPEPEVRANRIGIDTGAVYGGPLTCAVLEEEKVGFLSA